MAKHAAKKSAKKGAKRARRSITVKSVLARVNKKLAELKIESKALADEAKAAHKSTTKKPKRKPARKTAKRKPARKTAKRKGRKLTGAKKKAFLARMAKGRAAKARK